MDGYPRTVAQSRAFAVMLDQHSLTLDKVLFLSVDDQHIIQRLSGRWSCPRTGCKATFHTESNPPKMAMICDDCGTVLVQRDDDKEETVPAALVVYHRNIGDYVPTTRRRACWWKCPDRGRSIRSTKTSSNCSRRQGKNKTSISFNERAEQQD